MGKGAGKGRGGSTDDEDERPAPGADDDEPSGSFVEKFLEKNFEALGRSVARYPLAYIAVSLVVRDALRPPWPPAHCGPGGLSAGRERVQITVIASTGRIWLEAESRADKQWVPDGAQALLDADYVSATWPSEQRFNLWIATCPDIAEDEPDPNCNLLTAARMQALFAVRNRAVLTQGAPGVPA